MSALKDIPLRQADGTTTTLAAHLGKVVLIVNVASKCGLTPQYESLERLYTSQRDRGLLVLGFPCNQFRGQEPGSDEEIQSFCRSTYGVDFPVLSKIEVNGPERHPLYEALIAAVPDAQENEDGGMRAKLAQHGMSSPPGDVLWNFEKFLIGRDGRVVGRFAPDITVEAPPLRAAIETALDRAA